MPLPAFGAAYKEHVAWMDAAFYNDGARVNLPSKNQAIRFRQMCYNVRKLYREKGMAHVWDDLVIRLDGSDVVITSEPTKALGGTTLDGRPLQVHVSTVREKIDATDVTDPLKNMSEEEQREWLREKGIVNNDDIVSSLG